MKQDVVGRIPESGDFIVFFLMDFKEKRIYPRYGVVIKTYPEEVRVMCQKFDPGKQLAFYTARLRSSNFVILDVQKISDDLYENTYSLIATHINLNQELYKDEE